MSLITFGLKLSWQPIHLQNQLPSTLCRGAIPMLRFSPNSPLFPIPCVFLLHCLCSGPFILSLEIDSCVVKRIFVTNSHKKKVYRVSFPYTCHYVTLANITFHEESPFFFIMSTLSQATIYLPPSFLPCWSF